jgi:Transposase
MATLTVLERRERYYLGVDVGRRAHTLCALPRSVFETGGARWQHAPTLAVPVSRAGFEKIAALLGRLTDDPAGDVVAGLEPTGGYYARTVHAYLSSLGLPAHWVKNNAVHDARDAVCGKKTKTDPADARLIARDALCEAWRRAEDERVEVACGGGRGRPALPSPVLPCWTAYPPMKRSPSSKSTTTLGRSRRPGSAVTSPDSGSRDAVPHRAIRVRHSRSATITDRRRDGQLR